MRYTIPSKSAIAFAITAFVFVAAPAIAEGVQESASGESGVVNVYSARHYGAVEEVMERFTAETGIEVRIAQGSTQTVVERVRVEGETGPADAVITIDGGSIALLAEEGYLASIDSVVLEEAIPAGLRDEENRWFGLSQRVRTLMYHPENVSEGEIPATYADLANPRWQGRLALRPASHIYTIALVASLIANEGEAEAERIVQGWVDNNPVYINSDTRILQTIEAGGADAGITNHYYLGRILDTSDPEFPVQLVWANQSANGVHRNVVAMGVLETAPNRANAIRLLEWLATEGQGASSHTISGGNHEFPANPAATVHPVIAGFGEWTVDPLPLGEYGTYQAAALQLLERTGYGFSESQ